MDFGELEEVIRVHEVVRILLGLVLEAKDEHEDPIGSP